MNTVHKSVLLHETIEALAPKDGDVVLDLTLGGGGHSEAILASADVRLIGFDADPTAIERTALRLSAYKDRITLVESNFRDVGSVLSKLSLSEVDKGLLDLGLSSDELEQSGRGFSLLRDEPLHMGFSPMQNLTAADLLAHLSVEQLTDIIRTYGEERYAYRIANAIVSAREAAPITRTGELAELVKAAVPSAYARGRIHPATKTFQALRIAVNDEYDALSTAMNAVWERLREGGRLAIISFHSGEDRIVKQFMKKLTVEGSGILLHKKPITPSAQEVKDNPRARSAKLRAIQKTAP